MSSLCFYGSYGIFCIPLIYCVDFSQTSIFVLYFSTLVTWRKNKIKLENTPHSPRTHLKLHIMLGLLCSSFLDNSPLHLGSSENSSMTLTTVEVTQCCLQIKHYNTEVETLSCVCKQLWLMTCPRAALNCNGLLIIAVEIKLYDNVGLAWNSLCYACILYMMSLG